MVKLDGGDFEFRWFDASRYCNRSQILKLVTPVLVTLFEWVGKFIIPVETSSTFFLQYLSAKKDEWRDETHGIKHTGNCGKNLAGCVNLLGRVDGV